MSMDFVLRQQLILARNGRAFPQERAAPATQEVRGNDV